MARQPIVVEVNDDPIPLSIRGTVYRIRADVGADELVRTLAPFIDRADDLQAGNTDPVESVQVIGDAMDVLAGFLLDPEQADEWRALDLPVPAFMQVMQVLVEAWTGQGFTLPAN